MVPRITCRLCNNELSRQDKFCSKCGEKVDWELPKSVPPEQAPVKPVAISEGGRSCPLCGHQNPASASNCGSCGAQLAKSLKTGQPPKQKISPASSENSKGLSLKPLQSWKVTLGVAILLIAVVVVFKLSHSSDVPLSPPPTPAPSMVNTGEMMKRIETLQKQVETDPKDAVSILELANLLHDVKSLQQSIAMYKRYLDLNPSNADARVDLGISYFESSISDSLHREELLDTARKEMEQALTYAPNHQLACFNLGVVCLHTGDAPKAVEWFKKCIAIDPNSETGRRAQQLISQHPFNNPSQ
jgi:cytochrome c-type biogenesis protein CcmH/NrfG